MRKNLFGLEVTYEEWKHKDYLPVYILDSFNIYQANIGNTGCIMLKPLEELTTLPALKKQIKTIQTIDNVPVVLELDTVTSYRKQSLIENNISFITNKQLYLPFIGAMLMDEEESKNSPQKFVYSTQQLFLYYLYNNEKRIYVSDARRHLPYTAMTLTRAVKQLEATNLFFIGKDGVKKFIESKYNSRKDLFIKAKPYLATPVIRTGYIDKSQVTENMAFAGETALSKKTLLSPNRIITYAINEKDYDKKLLQEELLDPDKSVKLELWAYDPNKFSKDVYADDISVILSLKCTYDERIEEAKDALEENFFKIQ